MEHHQDTQLLYTDESTKAKLVGCAVTSSSQIIQQCVLPSYFSILSAELQPILLAVQHITQNSLQCGVICTDSLSAIQALSSTRQPHHPIISAFRATVLSEQLTIKLIRTPPHHNIWVANWPTQRAKKLHNGNLQHGEPSSANVLSTLKKYISHHLNMYRENLPESNKPRTHQTNAEPVEAINANL